jgi:hypothetical protein
VQLKEEKRIKKCINETISELEPPLSIYTHRNYTAEYKRWNADGYGKRDGYSNKQIKDLKTISIFFLLPKL